LQIVRGGAERADNLGATFHVGDELTGELLNGVRQNTT